MIALLLPRWSTPPLLLDPPADAPDEITFIAETFEASEGIVEDAYTFFSIEDLVWLATGILGFTFGLALLVSNRAPRPAAGIVAGLALISAAVISPPD